MLKLYTKDNCQPCNNVKAYLATREDLNVEVINCTEQPERIFEFSDFSKTFPTLVTDWGFVTNSGKILEHLASTQGGNQEDNQNQQTVAYQSTIPSDIDNKITRIPEPDCEACQ